MAFELKVDWERLQGKKLFIGVPMYGGMCVGMFARSMCDLSALCAVKGIQLQLYFLFNESLITRARNYCCDEFMRSGADHLMFIDADIGFNPIDIIALMCMQMEWPDQYDIVCGPYPKKCISWEKIKTAVDKGFADKDPNVLDRFVGDYVFNPVGESRSIPIGEPAQVSEAGTGFMMISRNALEKFQAAFPERMYRPDHVRTEHFDGTREIMMFFQAEQEMYNPEKRYQEIIARIANGEVLPAEEAKALLQETEELKSKSSNRYLSEDYLFCYMARRIGLKVWLCPWMRLQHTGTYVFGGSLADIAAIGASATADAGILRKNRENLKQAKDAAPVGTGNRKDRRRQAKAAKK